MTAEAPDLQVIAQLRLVARLLRGQWAGIFARYLVPIAMLEAGVVLATRGIAGHFLAPGRSAPGVGSTALVAGLVLVFLAVRGVAVSVIWSRLMRHVAEAQVALGRRLFDAFLRRPYADLIADERSRMLESLRSVSRGLLLHLLRPLMTGLCEALVALAILAVLVAVAPLATAVLLAWLAVASGALAWLTAWLARRFGSLRWEALHALRQLADYSFREIRTVRLSGVEPLLAARYEGQSRGFAQAVADDMALSNLPRHFAELTLLGAILLLVFYFAHTGHDPAASVRELAVFGIAGLRLLPAAQRMIVIAQQFNNNAPDIAQAIEDLNVAQLDLAPVAGPPQQPAFARELRLSGIAFGYRDGIGVVPPGTNLVLERGDRLHLSGPSGVGKSTLISILLGLLPPDAGQVEIDGAATDPLAWFRGRAVALVPQEPSLVSGTIAENLAFPRPADTLDRARAAEVLAALGLEQGLDDEVGDEGIALSGGQRQRVALARAIVAGPDLCVLDEATSQLDGAAEDRVFDALAHYLPGATLVVVAHQLHRPHRFTRRWGWDGARWVDEELARA